MSNQVDAAHVLASREIESLAEVRGKAGELSTKKHTLV
ncbi:hypothetical protein ppKF707_3942 [Metapseudomonas furukawaii]|uniref:Uncharacterized protein n=1 Tax=Metapseudomonas furukawaii TaxID=1149133 RepID=A0AAD1BY25_METFU|nr:hypothetical protein ppKF707_3942 [Pseudomonas furukawaii]BAU73726.1 hypothetical protein KF707C_20380 [Pseudomonas furukawaii]